MRKKTIQGSNLHEFDNTTSRSTLKAIFDALKCTDKMYFHINMV